MTTWAEDGSSISRRTYDMTSENSFIAICTPSLQLLTTKVRHSEIAN